MKPNYLLLLIFLIALNGCNSLNNSAISTTTPYPLHQNINSTVFWAGEEASEDNGWIDNISSAWDDNWKAHFGGTDDPDNRNGYYPAAFTPLENPFYFALPYNDYSDEGEVKANSTQVYWYSEKVWEHDESMCKNRWIKIIKGTLEAYAQWEDTGPYLDDDINYVFGTAEPSNTYGTHSGLDVSPAVRDYLGLDGTDIVSWQFIASSEVPAGPWTQIITTQQIDW